MLRAILTGGGTGGSVAPVLAVYEEMKKQRPEAEFLFVGTRKGIPERELVQNRNIPYKSIFSGKLRRYFSFKNIIDPFLILSGFIQSVFLILKFKPGAVFSAGGFVAVPLAAAAWLLKVPIFIHQQDIVPGLANKLIAPLARRITVSFEKSLKDFHKKKAFLTGNPVRPEILQGDKQKAIKRFQLEENIPTLLIIGGGTGARDLNELVVQIIPELVAFCQVVHLTGKNKSIKNQLNFSRYHQMEFLSEGMPDLYQASDLVVSRAGLGVLTELSVLKKPLILIPIPGSHQVANAEYFSEKKAAVLINQKGLTQQILLQKIRQMIFSRNELSLLSSNISKLARPEAARKITEIILKNI